MDKTTPLEFLNRQPWRSVRQVLLVHSTIGFFLLIALVILAFPFFYVDAIGTILYATGYAWLYLMLIGLIVLGFPPSVGLDFAAKNKLSPKVIIGLIVVFALTFSIVVPLVAVQTPFPVHCW